MQPLRAARIRDAIQPRAQLLVRARPGKQTAGQRTVIEAGAAGENGQFAARVNIADGCRSVMRKLSGRVHLRRIRDVDEMVRNPAPGLHRQLVGADVEATIDRRRIAVDDFAAVPLSQREAERAFPRGRRPQHGEDEWSHNLMIAARTFQVRDRVLTACVPEPFPRSFSPRRTRWGRSP